MGVALVKKGRSFGVESGPEFSGTNPGNKDLGRTSLRFMIEREQANGVMFGPAHQQFVRERAPEKLRKMLAQYTDLSQKHPEYIAAGNSFAGGDLQRFPTGSFTAVATTVTETNLWQPIAKWTPLAANSMTPGMAWEFEAGGVIGTTATPTIAITPRIGTSATSTSNVTMGVGTAVTLATITAQAWYARCVFGVRSFAVAGGASGALTGNGISIFANVAHGFGGTVTSTIDDTIAQGFMLSATWGTSSGSNTITCQWISFRSTNSQA